MFQIHRCCGSDINGIGLESNMAPGVACLWTGDLHKFIAPTLVLFLLFVTSHLNLDLKRTELEAPVLVDVFPVPSTMVF